MSLQKATNNCDTLSLRKALLFQLKRWQKNRGTFSLVWQKKAACVFAWDGLAKLEVYQVFSHFNTCNMEMATHSLTSPLKSFGSKHEACSVVEVFSNFLLLHTSCKEKRQGG